MGGFYPCTSIFSQIHTSASSFPGYYSPKLHSAFSPGTFFNIHSARCLRAVQAGRVYSGLRAAYGRKGDRFWVSSSYREKGGSQVFETELNEDIDGVGVLDDYHEDGVKDADDEMDMVGEMVNWLERKPKGFGEGKVYDTSIEDKLLDEIEQSRRAQAANINKLKNVSPESVPQSKDKKNDVGVTEKEFRVRVMNLPKKKNIQRDLRAAMGGVAGMINISPVVSGNKNTKDPICKGVAYVTFASESTAARFVELFSGQKLAFGKVEKRIKCQLLDHSPGKYAPEEFSNKTLEVPELTAPYLEEATKSDELYLHDKQDMGEMENVDREPDLPSKAQMRSLKLPENSAISDECLNAKGMMDGIHDVYGERESEDDEDDVDLNIVKERMSKNLEVFTIEDTKAEVRINKKLNVKSDPSEQLTRIRALEQRLLTREKANKSSNPRVETETVISARESKAVVEVKARTNQSSKARAVMKKAGDRDRHRRSPKTEIPGSSKRLKIKEKAVLTGVLSKYSAKKVSS